MATRTGPSPGESGLKWSLLRSWRRKLVTFGVLAAGLCLQFGTVAAAPAGPAIDPSTAPAGIDSSVLRAPTNGSIVATGRLVDAHGRPSAGFVAAIAWPNEDANRRINVGDSIVTPTVGWARAAADGAFSLRVDPSLVGADYLTPDGSVNLTAVGWNTRNQGQWSFPAHLGSSTSTALAASAADARPEIAIAATQPLSQKSSPQGTQTADGANAAAGVVCLWVLVSSFNVWALIGQTTPYGPDYGWMKSVSNQSMTVGVGFSSSGDVKGAYSASGSTTTSSGVTFTWPESIYYRQYFVQLVYGKYRWYCGIGTNSYMTQARYPTGGYTYGGIARTAYTHCAPVSAGVWERSSSSGNHFSTSAGVQIASIIGINLSLDTNYDTSHILSYRLAGDGKVCGDNNVPAFASNVTTAR